MEGEAEGKGEMEERYPGEEGYRPQRTEVTASDKGKTWFRLNWLPGEVSMS